MAWKAGGYLKEVIGEINTSQDIQVDDLDQISIYVSSSERDEDNPYSSIEQYLKKQIATAPEDQVFDEDFSLKSIYVPLKIKPVNSEGQIDKSSRPEEIEKWAESLLRDSKQAEKVMFIQGGPGRGKSVFLWDFC
ncbi:MAG: hypothetical protein HC930_07955 [Hydrococcus sp. SU_1_0]|nr:hypothetical protein [Hydrococcus sp. SU_1_0]